MSGPWLTTTPTTSEMTMVPIPNRETGVHAPTGSFVAVFRGMTATWAGCLWLSTGTTRRRWWWRIILLLRRWLLRRRRPGSCTSTAETTAFLLRRVAVGGTWPRQRQWTCRTGARYSVSARLSRCTSWTRMTRMVTRRWSHRTSTWRVSTRGARKWRPPRFLKAWAGP